MTTFHLSAVSTRKPLPHDVLDTARRLDRKFLDWEKTGERCQHPNLDHTLPDCVSAHYCDDDEIADTFASFTTFAR